MLELIFILFVGPITVIPIFFFRIKSYRSLKDEAKAQKAKENINRCDVAAIFHFIVIAASTLKIISGAGESPAVVLVMLIGALYLLVYAIYLIMSFALRE